MSVYLCETPVFRDGRVPVVQRAGHAAYRHPAGAVGGHARRLWSGRAAARPPSATLAARPEPATRMMFNMHTSINWSIADRNNSIFRFKIIDNERWKWIIQDMF